MAKALLHRLSGDAITELRLHLNTALNRFSDATKGNRKEVLNRAVGLRQS
jgi:hypothetical protein